MNRFLGGSTNQDNTIDDGTINAYFHNVRIQGLASNKFVKTNSYDQLETATITIGDVSGLQTDLNNLDAKITASHEVEEIKFNENATYTSYTPINFNNGISSNTTITNNNMVSKSSVGKSYVYSEGLFKSSLEDFEIYVSIASTPANNKPQIVLGSTQYTALAGNSATNFGETNILIDLLPSGNVSVLYYNKESNQHSGYIYSNSGVSSGDYIEIKCVNHVLSVYYNGNNTNLPSFTIPNNTVLYAGIVDENATAASFACEFTYKTKPLTFKMGHGDGHLVIADESLGNDILTVNKTEVNINTKLSGQDTKKITFPADRKAYLNSSNAYVICDTAGTGDAILYLPDLTNVEHSYFVYIFRVGVNKLQIHPHGTQNIDGDNVYLTLQSNYDSVCLYASVEPGATGKQWLCHSEVDKEVYNITQMLALTNMGSGKQVYNSDLKEMMIYDGTHWRIMSGNPQSNILATTSFTTSWTGGTANLYKTINASFSTTFVALSTVYSFKMWVYVDDGGISATNSVYFKVKDTGNNVDLIPPDIYYKPDEVGETYLCVNMIKTGLTVGTSYTVEPWAKSSTADQAVYIRSGGVYPNAMFSVTPMYGTSTF